MATFFAPPCRVQWSGRREVFIETFTEAFTDFFRCEKISLNFTLLLSEFQTGVISRRGLCMLFIDQLICTLVKH